MTGCVANGDNCDTLIVTASSYAVIDDDVGLRLRMWLRFRDVNGITETRTSGSGLPVPLPAPRVAARP